MVSNTGRESDKFMLRFPDGMRDRLKATAAVNGRSLNAEIIHRLTVSLSADSLFSPAGSDKGYEIGNVVEQLDSVVKALKELQLQARPTPDAKD